MSRLLEIGVVEGAADMLEHADGDDAVECLLDMAIVLQVETDIAIEAGDITLVSGDLDSVVRAVRLSRAAFAKIRQNLFWAFFYNIIAIPVAALGLLHPVLAEIAMAASSVNVVTSQYWNQVHGRKAEDVLRDEEGLQTMRTLGENMAWLMNSISAGRESGAAQPVYEKIAVTDFIR